MIAILMLKFVRPIEVEKTENGRRTVQGGVIDSGSLVNREVHKVLREAMGEVQRSMQDVQHLCMSFHDCEEDTLRLISTQCCLQSTSSPTIAIVE